MGRGRRGRARGSRRDGLEVNYEFDVYTQDDLGNPRIDVEARQDVEDDPKLKNEIGIFPGAIENFQATFDDDAIGFLFDFVGIGDFPADSPDFGDSIEEIPNPITLDLTAKLLNTDDDILFLDGAPLSESGGDIADKADFDRIEYTLTGSGLLNSGINELTLILKDVDTTKDGFQVYVDSSGRFNFNY